MENTGVRRVSVVACWFAAITASPVAGQTGSISGTVTTIAKGAPPLRVTIDQKICGDQFPDESIVVNAQGRLANAVISVVGLKRAATSAATVLNERCRFTPRVQVARPNATVRTSSTDPILHTTQAQLDTGRPLFNVALPVPGINIGKPVGTRGPVRLSCNIHPWMRGWVIVTEDASAITATDGRFTINDVPPGTYEVRVWHEALTGAPQKVTVTSGKTAAITFSLR